MQLPAQRACEATAYLDQEVKANPSLQQNLDKVENFIKNVALSSNATRALSTNGSAVIRIPVVVHVLYQNNGQNISDEQIRSGINALNRDFRRRNADTINTPSYFKIFGADAEIEFALATADPMGRATTGIVRKQTGVSSWRMDDKIKFSSQGGDDAWDSKSYLNIWVGHLYGLLGYASAPGGDVAKDGVVISASAFGTVNVASPYNLGRTAVHEVGHWLGLKHMWGDGYCGDDLVGDTPKQGSYTPGCPTAFRSSCSNGPNGDMYMNFMDFTDDGCMNLFTKGQKERMRAHFENGGPRQSLLNSKGLQQPWVEEAPVDAIPEVNNSFRFYPTPASNYIKLDFGKDNSWMGKEIRIVNLSGILVYKTIIVSSTQAVQLTTFKPGIYFIQADNGEQIIREKLVKL